MPQAISRHESPEACPRGCEQRTGGQVSRRDAEARREGFFGRQHGLATNSTPSVNDRRAPVGAPFVLRLSPLRLCVSARSFLSLFRSLPALAFVAGALSFPVACSDDGAGATRGFDFAAFQEPAVEARPWIRWWWPGNDVEPGELRRQLRALSGAYFGGAEIQPIDAALNPLDSEESLVRRRSWDTPAFYANLRAALEAARDEGLLIDLTLGSGWPTGGGFVEVEDSLSALVFSEHVLSGPGAAELQLTGPDLPPFYKIAEALEASGERLGRYLPELATPIAALAVRVTGGARSSSWLDLEDQLCLDAASVRDLSGEIREDGSLDWEAPAGDWRVIAFYRMPDGGYPSLSAEASPGFILDHFDLTAVHKALERLVACEGCGLEPFYGGAPLRGLFVDSFELTVERFWPKDMFATFEARRGYDLRPWLPALLVPGADNHLLDGGGIAARAAYGFSCDEANFDDEDDEGGFSVDARVRYDFQRTVSALFTEAFAGAVQTWAEARGLGLRIQAYGLNIDVLQALGQSAIPEVEQLYAGGPDLFLKLASSAAHLYGRPLASAEALVWSGRDHYNTPLMWKAALDKLFAAGINHAVYHGFPYSIRQGEPDEDPYGEGGWHAFSSPFGGANGYSSQLGEASPYWPTLPLLNRYVARCQHALRLGEPAPKLLVYYPWFGFPGSFARVEGHREPIYNGNLDPGLESAIINPLMAMVEQVFGEPDLGARGEWLRRFHELSEELRGQGYSWDWVNDDSLLQATVVDGALEIRGQRYEGLLLYDIDRLPVGLAQRLSALGQGGAPIALLGELPEHQPGLLDYEQGDQQVREAMLELLSGPLVTRAKVESLVSDLSEQLGILPALTTWPAASELRHVQRRLGEDARDPAQLVFLQSSSPRPLATALSLETGCPLATWLDPWSGEASQASLDEEARVVLRLAPYGSALLLCGTTAWDGANLAVPPFQEEAHELLGDWTLELPGVEAFQVSTLDEAGTLPDWRDLDAARYAAGPGSYSLAVTLPSPTAQRQLIDLGMVEGVAELLWDGVALATLLAPPFEVDISALATPGEHQLEVRVTPPLRNRLIGLALEGDPSAAQFDRRTEALAPAGLLGPVRLRSGK